MSTSPTDPLRHLDPAFRYYPSPPPYGGVSMPIDTAHVFKLCGQIRLGMEETSSQEDVAKRCVELGLQLTEALDLPIFDERGNVNQRCLDAVINAEVRLEPSYTT